MIRDPIVQEVHEVREKLLEEYGGDVERLMDRLKESEKKDQQRVITADQLKKQPSPTVTV